MKKKLQKTVFAILFLIPTLGFTQALQPIETSIYFDFNKSDIRPDAVIHLDSIANYMNAFPYMTLIMGGHCDSIGTAAYNIALSNQRNDCAISYLIAKGINRNRIIATAYGLSKLINHKLNGEISTESKDQLNRRVEFHFEGEIIGLQFKEHVLEFARSM
jgi:outer membrane protein OmpA-like peptidoglycan-associated protein